MQLKWTSKALADLARLYDFLAPVNRPAAAHTVQSLTAAPTNLLANPRIGEKLNEFEPREFAGFLLDATKFRKPPSMRCGSGTRVKIVSCGILRRVTDQPMK